ncbi:dihydrofolate reductase [Lichenihabitans psoromatis]|uniref:dihydrofolate reductase n=1 Tax=Lichenihabitans psoromatis TaxID=2528642 RepID=UPI00103839A8|nr:dihydrofolate reductase [Lichenihabitans psoromatis]
MTPLRLALIVAVARNGVIGTDNTLPWRLSSDLKHFRSLTMGKPILMGRKTWDSIGRPLPGRTVVVVSRNPDFAADGVEVASTLPDAIAIGNRVGHAMGAQEIMVAGGGTLYAALIGRADRLYVTEVDLAPAGDTIFPTIDPTQWREASRAPHPLSERDDTTFTFVTYDRR